jgi:hypothetical protein
MLGGNGDDTFTFDPTAAGFNPSPVATPDLIGDFDLFGDDRLNLGAAGNAVNFVNSGVSVATLGGATAVADGILNGSVIYVTVNVETSAEFPGGFSFTTDNTVVFWTPTTTATPTKRSHSSTPRRCWSTRATLSSP